MIGVLRRRDFLFLWCSGLVSVTGDSALRAVLPYVVYRQTGSTLATAGMIVAELLPGIVLGPFAGVLVDRWDQRRLLVAANAAQAAAVSALLLSDVVGLLSVVFVVAAVQSALAAFSMPAESALLPTLVEADQLVSANALNVLNNRLGRLLGLPLGPVLLAVDGLPLVVAGNASAFLLAAVLVAAMGATRPPDAVSEEDSASGFRAELLDGFRLVRDDRSIGMLFVVFGLMTFGGTMLDPLYVAWVRDVLGGDASVYAGLMTVQALAGVAASALVGAVGRRVSGRTLAGAASVLSGVLLVVRFHLPVLEVALALTALTGLTAVASAVGVETLAQERVPPHYRGRVFGTLQATIWLLSLLGAAVGGVGGELVGVLPMLDLAAGLTLAAGVVVLLAVPPPASAQRAGKVATPGGRKRAPVTRSDTPSRSR